MSFSVLITSGYMNCVAVILGGSDMETSGELGIWGNATNQYRSNGLGAGNILFDQIGNDLTGLGKAT